jgi:hypothetical protein
MSNIEGQSTVLKANTLRILENPSIHGFVLYQERSLIDLIESPPNTVALGNIRFEETRERTVDFNSVPAPFGL